MKHKKNYICQRDLKFINYTEIKISNFFSRLVAEDISNIVTGYAEIKCILLHDAYLMPEFNL